MTAYSLRHEETMIVLDQNQMMVLDYDSIPDVSEGAMADEPDVEKMIRQVEEMRSAKTEESESLYRRGSAIQHCTLKGGLIQVVNQLTSVDGLWAIYQTAGGARALRLDRSVSVQEHSWQELSRKYRCDPLYAEWSSQRGVWTARVSHKKLRGSKIRSEVVKLAYITGGGQADPEVLKMALVHQELLNLCGVGYSQDREWLLALGRGEIVMGGIPHPTGKHYLDDSNDSLLEVNQPTNEAVF